MSVFSAIVVFVLIWWMVFMCSLPFGLKSEAQKHRGDMPGAPSHIQLKKKIIIATAISFILWLVVCGIIMADIFSFRAIAEKMVF